MKELLTNYTAYNLWANGKMAAMIEKLPMELLHKEVASSFNSIHKTVLHIWDAEFIWISRMKGTSVVDWPSKMMDKDGFSFNLFLANSADFNDYVNSQSESFFTTNIEFYNLKKEKFNMPGSEIIMHTMNHSTYHRGQLVTMLRQVGITEIPSTDLTTFIRSK